MRILGIVPCNNRAGWVHWEGREPRYKRNNVNFLKDRLLSQIICEGKDKIFCY